MRSPLGPPDCEGCTCLGSVGDHTRYDGFNRLANYCTALNLAHPSPRQLSVVTSSSCNFLRAELSGKPAATCSKIVHLYVCPEDPPIPTCPEDSPILTCPKDSPIPTCPEDRPSTAPIVSSEKSMGSHLEEDPNYGLSCIGFELLSIPTSNVEAIPDQLSTPTLPSPPPAPAAAEPPLPAGIPASIPAPPPHPAETDEGTDVAARPTQLPPLGGLPSLRLKKVFIECALGSGVYADVFAVRVPPRSPGYANLRFAMKLAKVCALPTISYCHVVTSCVLLCYNVVLQWCYNMVLQCALWFTSCVLLCYINLLFMLAPSVALTLYS